MIELLCSNVGFLAWTCHVVNFSFFRALISVVSQPLCPACVIFVLTQANQWLIDWLIDCNITDEWRASKLSSVVRYGGHFLRCRAACSSIAGDVRKFTDEKPGTAAATECIWSTASHHTTLKQQLMFAPVRFPCTETWNDVGDSESQHRRQAVEKVPDGFPQWRHGIWRCCVRETPEILYVKMWLGVGYRDRLFFLSRIWHILAYSDALLKKMQHLPGNLWPPVGQLLGVFRSLYQIIVVTFSGSEK